MFFQSRKLKRQIRLLLISMSYLFIYLFLIEGEYGTDSNFESEWSDSQSEMEGYWSDDVLSDNKQRSSLWGKRIHHKNCFSDDLFSVTIN